MRLRTPSFIVCSIAFSVLLLLTVLVAPRIPASAASLSCIETDRGDVKEKAGFARLQSTEGVIATKPDVCAEDVLTEYYCTAQGEIAETTYTCPAGCFAGACRPVSAPPLPSAAAIERRKGRSARLSSGKTSFKRYFFNPRKIFQTQGGVPRRLPVSVPSIAP